MRVCTDASTTSVRTVGKHGVMGKQKRNLQRAAATLTFDTPLACCDSHPKNAMTGNAGLQQKLLPLATAVDHCEGVGSGRRVQSSVEAACCRVRIAEFCKLDGLYDSSSSVSTPHTLHTQYYHASRSVVSANSPSGRCACRMKVCLTSDSCCRWSNAARKELQQRLCLSHRLLYSPSTVPTKKYLAPRQ